MQPFEHIPKIIAVKALDAQHLMVTFEGNIIKRYDCTTLLAMQEFKLLKTYAFFKAAQVDAGGYGIAWNDGMDVSGYELWKNGVLQ
uniref:DUF2442 domain-containing protein n=1 Tax=Chlorobium chlorochromatii (strain CaD3) TaxID=340177 RepID=Q3ARD2_CHLCH